MSQRTRFYVSVFSLSLFSCVRVAVSVVSTPNAKQRAGEEMLKFNVTALLWCVFAIVTTLSVVVSSHPSSGWLALRARALLLASFFCFL
jgi:hypothetical protein